MKKFKKFIACGTIGMLGLMSSVNAAELTQEEHDRLSIIFSEPRIENMTQEDADRYLSYDLENSIIDAKYYKVTESANGTISKEVTKNEAENAANAITPYGVSYSTSYKKIQISATSLSGNTYMVSLSTQWLINPATKSYDVTAIRVDDGTVVEGHQAGIQFYKIPNNSTYQTINYSYNGSNMVRKDNGFGISMNLVDDGNNFMTDIEGMFTATSNYSTVYGSYQHAVRNMTLAQSKSYNISHNGLGKVVNFTTDVINYYDGMQGVSIALPYNG